MSISAISGSSALDYTNQSQTQPSHRHHAPLSFTDTASLLGISTGTLTGDLQSGDTLSSLASIKRVQRAKGKFCAFNAAMAASELNNA